MHRAVVRTATSQGTCISASLAASPKKVQALCVPEPLNSSFIEPRLGQSAASSLEILETHSFGLPLR